RGRRGPGHVHHRRGQARRPARPEPAAPVAVRGGPQTVPPAAPCAGGVSRGRRGLRERGTSAGLDEAGELPDDGPEVGLDAEQAELRALVWSALSGLNPGEREIIELNLRHELEGADLAAALGVPRNQAHALASRARGQFETALGALLVARYGQQSCADLADILAGWDGELTVLLRKRINRHID